MTTAWDPTLGDEPDRTVSPDICPRCGRGDDREHLMQTQGVAFYRCGACGHMFVVRTSAHKAS